MPTGLAEGGVVSVFRAQSTQPRGAFWFTEAALDRVEVPWCTARQGRTKRRVSLKSGRPAVLLGTALTVAIGTLAIAAPTVASTGGSDQGDALRKKGVGAPKAFVVCKRGCPYRTIQEGANAAGKYQAKSGRGAEVKVKPGTYKEGVLLNGKRKGHDFDGLAIIGVKKNGRPNPSAKGVTLEGDGAKVVLKGNDPYWVPGDPAIVPAGNGIEGRSVNGLVLENLYARNYGVNGFFVWASTNRSLKERCNDYTMENLWASSNRSYGLYARNCFGGAMVDSRGWYHGDSAFYVGETPCDSDSWNNLGSAPTRCQRKPKWTLLSNLDSFQNVLGYSGTNAKYVRITKSRFYNNGAGIVPNTLDSERFEPSGWSLFDNNDIFWNNYNYFRPDSAFTTVSSGLGELLGQTVNYPMGVGVILFGTDGIEVKNNRIFGHAKWGAAAFSAPVVEGVVIANEDDDAKNLNNEFKGNKMGWNGTYPNGFDFLSDYSGGGNCWSDNGSSATWVVGNGSVPPSSIYPGCPQPGKLNSQTSSFSPIAGIQLNLDNEKDPSTVLGYAASSPPDSQECSWTIPPATGSVKAPTNGRTYKEKRTSPPTCP